MDALLADEEGEILFVYIIAFIIPMDVNITRAKSENERKNVSKLLLTNHYWYKVIKAGYCNRLYIYEVISQHYDSLDFELLIKYCVGEEYTKNINFSKALSFTDNTCLLLLNKAPQIEYLNLGGCFNISDISLKYISKKLKYLKGFNITACTNNFSVRCMEMFINTRGSRLVDLNLSKCKFVDDSLMHIIAKKCKLKILNVSSCNLGDLSCKYLAEEQDQLHTLDLSSNVKISDDGIITVMERIGMKLKEIKIEGLNLLTKTSFMALSMNAKFLERLSLSQCPGLTDPSLHVLTQTLPELTWL